MTRYSHHESCGRCHRHPCSCPKQPEVTAEMEPFEVLWRQEKAAHAATRERLEAAEARLARPSDWLRAFMEVADEDKARALRAEAIIRDVQAAVGRSPDVAAIVRELRERSDVARNRAKGALGDARTMYLEQAETYTAAADAVSKYEKDAGR